VKDVKVKLTIRADFVHLGQIHLAVCPLGQHLVPSLEDLHEWTKYKKY
jgi:hypothetical protein